MLRLHGLRQLSQAQGLDWQLLNNHNQGVLNKASWFGHALATEWMLLDSTGPQLAWQLSIVDQEGYRPAELAHCAGYFELACWMANHKAAAAPASARQLHEEEVALRVAFRLESGAGGELDTDFLKALSPVERKWRKAVLHESRDRLEGCCESPVLRALSREQLVGVVAAIEVVLPSATEGADQIVDPASFSVGRAKLYETKALLERLLDAKH